MQLTPRQMQLLERAAPLVRGALALALMVWLAKVVADTALLSLAGPAQVPEPDDDMARVEVTERTGAGGELSTARVADWELFGEYEPEEREVRVVDAPDTTLQLKLLGLFEHSDPQKARAIIEGRGGDAELYYPGDDLPGGAVLEEIYVDRVILRHRGELEALRFDEPELGGATAATPDGISRRSASRSNGSPPRPPQQADTMPEGLPGDPREQRETIIRDLALQPVEEGASSGYRITDRSPREIISQVGLRPGDQIISVNGHSLGEEGGDVAALEEVMETGSATIEVRRGSRTFTVSYPP